MNVRRAGWRWALLGFLATGLAACGAAAPPATATAAATPTAGPAAPPESLAALQADLAGLPAGNATAGQAVFSAVGCVACHSLQAGVRIVGPSLAGVATRAASRKPGYSAQLYLYESITHPNAYVVDGFPSGVMPPDFKSRLQPQDLSNLIDFLMTER